MKNFLILANWKLNGSKNKISKFIQKLEKNLNKKKKNYDLAIAFPVMYIDFVYTIIKNKKIISLAAQNVDIHSHGSFTGDISAGMLKDIQVKYVIIGHSERRINHKENNETLAKKFMSVKENGMIPVLCIGENKKEKENGKTKEKCIEQIDTIFKYMGTRAFHNSIIAYEPIWSIGTGEALEAKQIQETCAYIKEHIQNKTQDQSPNTLPNIQYGGSVTEKNIKEICVQKDVDGVLIGSASLQTNSLLNILNSVN